MKSKKGILSQCKLVSIVAVSLCLAAPIGAAAQQMPGISDTEIRIGNINPYTGPAAAYGTIGRTLEAFFDMINDQGGINGRLVRFISYDDGYNPTRTLEQARRLVENDDVLLIFQSLGIPPNLAIRDYMNEVGVPQLFMAAGAWLFDDPTAYPWTMPWTPSVESEMVVFADHIAETFAEATVGVLYLNDAFGQQGLAALTGNLGSRYEVIAQPVDVGEPTVDAQIAAFRAAGADVLVNMAGIRAAILTIRRLAELQWQPYHMVNSAAASIESTFRPAGIEDAIGIITVRYSKDPGNQAFADDPGLHEFLSFWESYGQGSERPGVFESYAFNVASALVEVLRRCGDDLSRENVMRQAASLTNLELPMLVPGVTVTTDSDDFAPIEQFRLSLFDGEAFVYFGEVMDAAR